MKLITLNTWGGQLYKPFTDFVKKNSAVVDIFCFQEVFSNAKNPRRELGPVVLDLYERLTKILPDFMPFYAGQQSDDEGLAMFVKKGIDLEGYGDIFVYKYRDAMVGNDGTTTGRNIQYAEIKKGNNFFTVGNFHGSWSGVGKRDNEVRIIQAENVKRFLENAKGPKILCGDFNLDPNTKSMKIMAEGMRDLIAENKISSTRTSHYKHSRKASLFADYILVSKDIKVKDFRVLADIVSDHSPLFLDFST